MGPDELFSVKDMVVVITGGGTGIGLMMTKAFAYNGAAKVYIVGRRKEKLEEAAKLSPNIVPLVGDVTSKESLCGVAERVKQDAGFVNFLCVNSGFMPPSIGVQPSDVTLQEYAKKVLEQKVEDWEKTFSTNSVAVAFTTFAFLELLDAGNKKGNCAGRQSQVLVTTSIAGYLRNANNFSVYGTSKAAATHLTKQLSGALSTFGIRVNGIAPGLFPSDLAAGLIKKNSLDNGKDPTEEGSFDRTTIPAMRTGRDDDMIGTVLYMASAAAAYMNGNIVVLDGGRIGMLPATY